MVEVCGGTFSLMKTFRSRGWLGHGYERGKQEGNKIVFPFEDRLDEELNEMGVQPLPRSAITKADINTVGCQRMARGDYGHYSPDCASTSPMSQGKHRRNETLGLPPTQSRGRSGRRGSNVITP